MRRTLRLRLALLYSGVFLASGVILLALVAALFSASSTTRPGPGQSLTSGPPPPAPQQGADLHALLISSATGLTLMVVVAVVLGWVIAGRALRPLHTMMTTAREISASNLHSRVDLDSPYEEFKELGATLDDLFGRLDAAFQSQQHFVANASHELRTPLTAQRALLQVTLADPDASTATLRSTCEELLTLGATQERLIESLLTLASSEQGVEQWEPLDLSTITAEAILARRAQAQQRGIRLDASLADAPTAGDPRLIESLAANLIDNAIRHNVTNGRVDVTTWLSELGACLAVRNTGPVVPAGEVARLCVPFQRLPTERSRHPDGHGLGLAIVSAITTAHRATLVTRTPQAGGLDVRVTFPPRPPAGTAAPNDPLPWERELPIAPLPR